MSDDHFWLMVTGLLLIIVLLLGVIPLAKLITNWIVERF